MELRNKEIDFLVGLGIERKMAEAIILDLETAYHQEWRYYHTLDHIFAVLQQVDRLVYLAKNPAAVRLAALFHDVVYIPTAKDNEEQSAEYAGKILSGTGLASELIEEVKRLVLATKTHSAGSEDIGCQVLLDADLSILGSNAEHYIAYTENIRLEYAEIPEEQYRVGRKQVMEKFLMRPRLYFTDVMFDAYEQQARHNITEEIKRLASG
jgi:predicted metal-dependent HD superfamily phosphohydrolase